MASWLTGPCLPIFSLYLVGAANAARRGRGLAVALRSADDLTGRRPGLVRPHDSEADPGTHRDRDVPPLKELAVARAPSRSDAVSGRSFSRRADSGRPTRLNGAVGELAQLERGGAIPGAACQPDPREQYLGGEAEDP